MFSVPFSHSCFFVFAKGVFCFLVRSFESSEKGVYFWRVVIFLAAWWRGTGGMGARNCVVQTLDFEKKKIFERKNLEIACFVVVLFSFEICDLRRYFCLVGTSVHLTCFMRLYRLKSGLNWKSCII